VFRPDPEKQIARMSVHKMKDGDKVDDVFFEMERIVLGQDDDGDENDEPLPQAWRITCGENAAQAIVVMMMAMMLVIIVAILLAMAMTMAMVNGYGDGSGEC
jgi:hypothetical protein